MARTTIDNMDVLPQAKELIYYFAVNSLPLSLCNIKGGPNTVKTEKINAATSDASLLRKGHVQEKRVK